MLFNEAPNLVISKRANVHSTVIFLGGKVSIMDDVEIGPYCVFNGNITINKGVKIASHVAISGNTEIGEDTTIYSFASVGSFPQDLKYKGEESFLVIGKRNIIRENATINCGTEHGGLYTRIGDDNLFMIGSHIGHDCQVGNSCVIANNVAIAGHVVIQDSAIIGGNSAIQQFVRIGQNAMVGGMSGVIADIPPFSLYIGNRVSVIRGLNLVGLKRHGFTKDNIKQIKDAYEFIFKGNQFYENAGQLKLKNADEKVSILVDFVLEDKNRTICAWNKSIELAIE